MLCALDYSSILSTHADVERESSEELVPLARGLSWCIKTNPNPENIVCLLLARGYPGLFHSPGIIPRGRGTNIFSPLPSSVDTLMIELTGSLADYF